VIKRSLLAIFVLIIVAQFFRSEKNLGVTGGPNDLTVKYAVPGPVKDLLQRACYDCHSNRTRYPWYSEIQPVGWWLAQHVSEAKNNLNFSEFGAYPAKRMVTRLEQISEDVSEKAMPLPSYTWAHPDARLTAEEIKLLTDWAESLHDEIAPE
jgi:hypothetical protein